MTGLFARIHIVINPAAGNDEPILNTLNDVFQAYDVAWEVSLTHAAGDAARQAREAAQAGADLVAGYGGDGTISEVANGLIGTGVPLAVLPGGTGNAVALELGIPGRLRQAAEVICDPASTFRPLDLGRVGEQYFVLRASIGMQARLAEQATREMKSRYGNLAYLFSALSTLTDRPTATYTLTIDGEQVMSEGFTCLINNCGSIGGLNVSLNADIDPSDGMLDVFVLKEYTDPLLSIAADAFPQAELNKMLQYWQGREIEVVASEPQPVRLDGELYGETPLTVAVEPGAIQVLVPGK